MDFFRALKKIHMYIAYMGNVWCLSAIRKLSTFCTWILSNRCSFVALTPEFILFFPSSSLRLWNNWSVHAAIFIPALRSTALVIVLLEVFRTYNKKWCVSAWWHQKNTTTTSHPRRHIFCWLWKTRKNRCFISNVSLPLYRMLFGFLMIFPKVYHSSENIHPNKKKCCIRVPKKSAKSWNERVKKRSRCLLKPIFFPFHARKIPIQNS